jgi:uncharacterized membrane protein (DUF485 family)
MVADTRDGEVAGAGSEAVNSAEFRALVGRKKLVALLLTLGILTVYFGFIFLLAFDKPLVGMKLSDRVTLGIPMGLGVILASCALAAYYLRWADGKYDEKAEALRAKWGK